MLVKERHILKFLVWPQQQKYMYIFFENKPTCSQWTLVYVKGQGFCVATIN
jgi:hypothetical protein